MTLSLPRWLCPITILLIVASCAPKQTKTTRQLLIDDTVAVLVDSTSTWEQVIDAVKPLKAILTLDLSDEGNISRRLNAQEIAYTVMRMGIDKIIKLKRAGIEITDEEWDAAFGNLRMLIHNWFWFEDEDTNVFWRDHFYVSSGSIDCHSTGFLTLVAFQSNSSEDESSYLQVSFPKTAEGIPFLQFSDSELESEDENRTIQLFDYWDMVYDEEYKEDRLKAHVGMEAINNMLKFPVMYVVFQSKSPQEGEEPILESARVILKPFQDLWHQKVKE